MLQAVRNNNIDEVRTILKRGADVNDHMNDVITDDGIRDEVTVLHMAAYLGHADIAKYLLDHGANLHEVDFERKTPMHYAAEKGRIEIIKILMDYGADLHARDRYDRTPLHYATREGRLETTTFLVNQGANLRARNRYMYTPLHEAIESECTEIVDWLVARKIQVAWRAHRSVCISVN